MKKLIFLIGLILISCEDVIEVDLEESAPRLVVEASLIWNKDRAKQSQYIILTTTAPYFEKEIPPASEATVSVFAPDGTEFIFEEREPGIFTNDEILPATEGVFELVINYQGEVYKATERYISTPELEEIVQEDNRGISGEETEFRLFYTDPEGEDNYYLFLFTYTKLSLQIYEAEFTDGNRTFAFFSAEDVYPGDKVGFEIQGISKRFYNYLYLLRSQSGTAGGPFQTQPTVVRGNVVNTTSPDNFAFGYFRLSEADYVTYTVQ